MSGSTSTLCFKAAIFFFFLMEPMLDNLLETLPMLVPFRNDNHGLRSVVQPVAIYLRTSLYDVLQQAKGLGGYKNS